MGRGVMNLCWTCLETCLELPKSRYLISYIVIWWINSKVPEGLMITSENNSVARESSCMIILKSRLNSTGHSPCTSEVCYIFDHQTHVPNYWWQPMCLRVLQPWDYRNSMTVPIRNITICYQVYLSNTNNLHIDETLTDTSTLGEWTWE